MRMFNDVVYAFKDYSFLTAVKDTSLPSFECVNKKAFELWLWIELECVAE